MMPKPCNLLYIVTFSCLSSMVRVVQPSPQLINVWPMPRNLSWPIPAATTLPPTFRIITPPHHHLRLAAANYLNLILSEHYHPIVPPTVNSTASTSYPLTNLSITVADLAAPLQHGADETYTLTIPTSGGAGFITAATAWGALRGLETFSQLVWGGGSSALMVAVGVEVWDAPLFSHRGVMLDTSRNYYPVEDLLRTIRAMSYNKLNVFHWHITDSHSFPLVLPSEPELAGKGAYLTEMVYTPADVRRIVEYGMEFGVRVMPEIDMPGMV